MPSARVDRDGHNGWSRRSEAAWARMFAPRPLLGFTEAEERAHLERMRYEVNRQIASYSKEPTCSR